jgi:hypothetical protein
MAMAHGAGFMYNVVFPEAGNSCLRSFGLTGSPRFISDSFQQWVFYQWLTPSEKRLANDLPYLGP